MKRVSVKSVYNNGVFVQHALGTIASDDGKSSQVEVVFDDVATFDPPDRWIDRTEIEPSNAPMPKRPAKAVPAPGFGSFVRNGLTVRLVLADETSADVVLATVTAPSAHAWAKAMVSIGGAKWETPSDMPNEAYATIGNHEDLPAKLRAEGYTVDDSEWEAPDDEAPTMTVRELRAALEKAEDQDALVGVMVDGELLGFASGGEYVPGADPVFVIHAEDDSDEDDDT